MFKVCKQEKMVQKLFNLIKILKIYKGSFELLFIMIDMRILIYYWLREISQKPFSLNEQEQKNISPYFRSFIKFPSKQIFQLAKKLICKVGKRM